MNKRFFVAFIADCQFGPSNFDDIIEWDQRDLMELKYALSESIKRKYGWKECAVTITCLTKLD